METAVKHWTTSVINKLAKVSPKKQTFAQSGHPGCELFKLQLTRTTSFDPNFKTNG
jgi:hypothetical protein